MGPKRKKMDHWEIHEKSYSKKHRKSIRKCKHDLPELKIQRKIKKHTERVQNVQKSPLQMERLKLHFDFFLGTPFQAVSGILSDLKNHVNVLNYIKHKLTFSRKKQRAVRLVFYTFLGRRPEADYKKKTAFRHVF